MSFVALELNDMGLVLRRQGEDGALRGPAPIPGAVYLEGATVHVGHEALSRSRSLPRFLHESFWSGLSEEPLPRPFPQGLRAADLARHQLGALFEAELREGEACCLAVPGCLTEDQLALLLGVAVSLERPFSGLMDSALAAVSGQSFEGRALHVDLQLHRLVLTELKQGETLERRSVVVLREAGHRDFREAALRRLSALCVEATRFDPLHEVSSERQLLAALPAILAELAAEQDSELKLTDPQGEEELRVRLEQGCLDGAARPLLAQLDVLQEWGPVERVFVSARAATVPGLLRSLGEWSDASAGVLSGDAACQGVLAHASPGEAEGGSLPLVLSLAGTRT